MIANWLTCFGFVLASAAASGCAGIRVEKLPDSAEPSKDSAKGFRYYETSPYIVVYSDGKSGLTSKLVHLPDPTRKMSARPYAFLASNQTNLKFDQGTLRSASTVGDAAALPKAVIEVLKTAAELVMVAGDAQFENVTNASGFQVPVPKLFKVVVSGKDTKLITSDPKKELIEIRVDIPTGGAP